MSMVNPAKIQFENQRDIIDYVTKGMPPRRKDFNDLMGAIQNRDNNVGEGEQAPIPGTHVIVSPGIEFDMDDDALVNAMGQVYRNRCRNRNILIGAAVIVGGIVIMGGVRQHNRIKELESENEKMSQIIEDDLPVVNISTL